MTNSIDYIADQIHKANAESNRQKLIADYLSEKCYILHCELSRRDNRKVLSSEDFYAEAEEAVDALAKDIKDRFAAYKRREEESKQFKIFSLIPSGHFTQNNSSQYPIEVEK